MSERSPSSSAYERIAHLYDVDMARNLPFDDVSLYVALAKQAGGRVLEVGCGNGRILLELLGSRIDAYGIDRSAAMLEVLAAKAARRALNAPVCRMDARALGFTNAFMLALCPYSLITYMREPGDAEAMLGAVRHALVAGGSVVIDAFIPKTDTVSTDFRIDYRRQHRGGTLTRWKRVLPVGPGVNRVERRYELVAPGGQLMECINTSEEIRLFMPRELMELLRSCGFAVDDAWWDYVKGEPQPDARFFTVRARARAAG